MKKITGFIVKHKFLTAISGLFIVINIYNCLKILVNLGNGDIIFFVVVVLASIILSIVAIIFGIVVFKKSKSSALLTPIIAMLCTYFIIANPLFPVYLRLNHQIHLNERYAYINDVQNGSIPAARRGIYVDLPPEYRSISNVPYVVIDEGKTTFCFIVLDGILGAYTGIMYGNPYEADDVDLKHKPINLGTNWYYIVSY